VWKCRVGCGCPSALAGRRRGVLAVVGDAHAGAVGCPLEIGKRDRAVFAACGLVVDGPAAHAAQPVLRGGGVGSYRFRHGRPRGRSASATTGRDGSRAADRTLGRTGSVWVAALRRSLNKDRRGDGRDLDATHSSLGSSERAGRGRGRTQRLDHRRDDRTLRRGPSANRSEARRTASAISGTPGHLGRPAGQQPISRKASKPERFISSSYRARCHFVTGPAENRSAILRSARCCSTRPCSPACRPWHQLRHRSPDDPQQHDLGLLRESPATSNRTASSASIPGRVPPPPSREARADLPDRSPGRGVDVSVANVQWRRRAIEQPGAKPCSSPENDASDRAASQTSWARSSFAPTACASKNAPATDSSRDRDHGLRSRPAWPRSAARRSQHRSRELPAAISPNAGWPGSNGPRPCHPREMRGDVTMSRVGATPMNIPTCVRRGLRSPNPQRGE
jgi:hypothetical protein